MSQYNDPSPSVRDVIRRHIEDYCLENGGRVLLAVIVGSRIKGLENSRSDYDIRVVWQPDINKYLTIDGMTSLENGGKKSLTEDDVLFEYLYWDLKRFLTLLRSSNSETIDALLSPLSIVVDEVFVSKAKHLLESHFSSRQYAYCLHANASANYTRFCCERETVHPANYLYVAYPVLGLCYLYSRKSVPPFLFDDRVRASVIDHSLYENLSSLAHRKRSCEGSEGSPKLIILEEFFKKILSKDPLVLPTKDAAVQDFDKLFSSTILGSSPA